MSKAWEEGHNATECSCCDERKISEEWKQIIKYSHICWKCWVEEIA